jgi:hypothetical protein
MMIDSFMNRAADSPKSINRRLARQMPQWKAPSAGGTIAPPLPWLL